jgi:hypothetical protein
MSARVAMSALLFAAFATITLGPGSNPAGGAAAAQAGPWSLSRGEYQSEVQTATFSTQSGYDADGTRLTFYRPTDPGPGFKLEQLAFSWRNEVGWRKRLSLQFGVTGLVVTGFDGPPLAVPTQVGLSEFQLGLHYNIMNGSRAMAFEAGWRAPAGYDRELSPDLGDGRQEFSGRLHLGSSLGERGFFQLSGGGSYRFHKLGSSSAKANLDPLLTTNVYYDFGADMGLWIGRSMMLGGRYQGRMLGSTTGEGGTSNVHWVGPIELRGNAQLDESAHVAGPFLRVRLDDRLDMTAGSYSTPAGKNTLHFDQFYLSLAFRQSKLKRNQGFLGSSAP